MPHHLHIHCHDGIASSSTDVETLKAWLHLPALKSKDAEFRVFDLHAEVLSNFARANAFCAMTFD